MSQRAGENERRERSFYVWAEVGSGQRMKRLEMGRVIEGLGMRREIEGPGSEEGRRVCR